MYQAKELWTSKQCTAASLLRCYSEYGYDTISYLRLESISKEVNIAFMVGKSRVAPIKQTTIPRLKFTTAVLAVRVDKMIKNELQLELDPTVLWIDSTTMPNYILSETKRFHTFVANRVAVIHEFSLKPR